MCINCNILLSVRPGAAKILNLPANALVTHRKMIDLLEMHVSALTDENAIMAALCRVPGFKPFCQNCTPALNRDNLRTFLELSDLNGLFQVSLKERNFTNLNSWELEVADEPEGVNPEIARGTLVRSPGSARRSIDDYDTTQLCYESCHWSVLFMRDPEFVNMILHTPMQNGDNIHAICRRCIESLRVSMRHDAVWNTLMTYWRENGTAGHKA